MTGHVGKHAPSELFCHGDEAARVRFLVGFGAEQQLAAFEDRADDVRILQIHVHQRANVTSAGAATLM